MRHIKLIALVVMACLTIGNAQGQLRFGLRGGMVINELKFNKKVFESENKVGWTAGLQLELDMPLGFGIDASAMYSHRNDAFGNDDHVYHRDYIEVPVHLKYKFGLIGVDRVLVPYVYTGPNFAFLVDESDYYKNDLSKTGRRRRPGDCAPLANQRHLRHRHEQRLQDRGPRKAGERRNHQGQGQTVDRNSHLPVLTPTRCDAHHAMTMVSGMNPSNHRLKGCA